METTTNKIGAKILADSINEFGNRITTMVIKFPRYILAELNTHRAISKNSASSRAKPFKTMLRAVETDPFVPVQWMKDHKGMQGNEYFDTVEEKSCIWDHWMESAEAAIDGAKYLSEDGLTKQIVNRILEPFMWHEVIVTATEWENFFGLRCPEYRIEGENPRGKSAFYTDYYYRSRKDVIACHPEYADYTDLQWRKLNSGQADIHIMDLAEAMWDAREASTPVPLKAGEWHMPYTDDINLADFYRALEGAGLIDSIITDGRTPYDIMQPFLLKVSAARCARISYKTFGEDSKIDWIADIQLHDRLLISQPIHASPAEHQGRAMSKDELDDNFRSEGGQVTLGTCRNFVGFKQYRVFLNNETIQE